MEYFDFQKCKAQLDVLDAAGALALENGCDAAQAGAAYEELKTALDKCGQTFRRLYEDAAASADEPDDYPRILALCGEARPAKPVGDLHGRIKAALLGRFAGCVLGAPVEMWDLWNMENMAKSCGMEFPPQEYWHAVERPWALAFEHDRRALFSLSGMDGCPVDDDVTYVILSLLIMERYGKDFTTADVGAYWKEHLPIACTAELAALNNLKAGVPAERAALIDNPYAQWIGALIRADGFGYACAGDPRKAAELAYRDAYLTHRRNGIYGEMLFAAAIAAAFAVTDPLDAVRIGLNEIPHTSALWRDVNWALETAPSIRDFRHARQMVDEHFPGMSCVHTNNNACMIVFALALGGGDLSKTITTAVAMGLDNDCTAATCGSLVGACKGLTAVEEKWYKPFHDRVRTYITGAEELSIDDVAQRFEKLHRSFFTNVRTT